MITRTMVIGSSSSTTAASLSTSQGTAASSSTTADDTTTSDQKGDRVELSGQNKTLSKGQQKDVDQLKKRDADVHRHEQAHLAAAGSYARSGAHYDYETGPDGKQYAVGGEVQIDSGPVPNDPQATIKKEETVQRAALAPADPSGDDRAVAAQAAQAEDNARSQLFLQKSGKDGKGKNQTGTTVDVTA